MGCYTGAVAGFRGERGEAISQGHPIRAACGRARRAPRGRAPPPPPPSRPEARRPRRGPALWDGRPLTGFQNSRGALGEEESKWQQKEGSGKGGGFRAAGGHPRGGAAARPRPACTPSEGDGRGGRCRRPRRRPGAQRAGVRPRGAAPPKEEQRQDCFFFCNLRTLFFLSGMRALQDVPQTEGQRRGRRGGTPAARRVTR